MTHLKHLSGAALLALTTAAALLAPAHARTAPTVPDPEAAAAVGWPPAAPSQLVIDTQGQPIGRDDYVAGTATLDGVTHVTEVLSL